jgi:hypothetical protein
MSRRSGTIAMTKGKSVNIEGILWVEPHDWKTNQRLFSRRELTFILLVWRNGRAPNSIPIYSYIQQDAMLHSLCISGNCSTCFGWYFPPSSGAHTTVSTASGICHTVIAICRYRGRVGTGLSVLWVAYATHSTLKPLCIMSVVRKMLHY